VGPGDPDRVRRHHRARHAALGSVEEDVNPQRRHLRTRGGDGGGGGRYRISLVREVLARADAGATGGERIGRRREVEPDGGEPGDVIEVDSASGERRVERPSA
jgi:hypothetical protein